MKRVACTIVSANYLHFGWTLAESFLKFHPNDEFHLLLVDRLPQDFVSRDPRVQVSEVEKLGLPAFRSLAFKYDILELNTNVKPALLKTLFARGADKVIYFDPDILICSSVDLIYDALDTNSIVITPHILSPTRTENTETKRAALHRSFQSWFRCHFTGRGRSFLDWWEHRCLTLGSMMCVRACLSIRNG